MSEEVKQAEPQVVPELVTCIKEKKDIHLLYNMNGMLSVTPVLKTSGKRIMIPAYSLSIIFDKNPGSKNDMRKGRVISRQKENEENVSSSFMENEKWVLEDHYPVIEVVRAGSKSYESFSKVILESWENISNPQEPQTPSLDQAGFVQRSKEIVIP